MDKLLHISVSPHIHGKKSTAGIMRDVLIALLPATVAGIIIFGLRALLVVGVCVASCVIFEALFNIITKKEQTIGDLSAAVTGLLLGLNLPVNIPVWQAVIGSLFAIVIVKCLFGGLGFNVVNPAITARVFMLIAFSSMVVAGQPVDSVSSATPLPGLIAGGKADLKELLLGTHGGSIGETCAIALVLGGFYLLIREVISWHIPVAFIGSSFVLSLLVNGFDFTNALGMVLSGGLLLGAFFMATDYVTSPSTALGKIIYGVGAGLLTFLIRYFGIYPEGVSFAILLMNILNPYIDDLTAHKVFGGKKA